MNSDTFIYAPILLAGCLLVILIIKLILERNGRN